MEHVGPNLRHYRKLKGLTQTDLAQASGVSQDTISQLELGKREPQGRTLRRLAEALNVPVTALWQPPGQEVIDLANEGYAGARAVVAEAPHDKQPQLVAQYRAAAADAVWQWMSQPDGASWWHASATVQLFAAVLEEAGEDCRGVVEGVNEVWRKALERRQES